MLLNILQLPLYPMTVSLFTVVCKRPQLYVGDHPSCKQACVAQVGSFFAVLLGQSELLNNYLIINWDGTLWDGIGGSREQISEEQEWCGTTFQWCIDGPGSLVYRGFSSTELEMDDNKILHPASWELHKLSERGKPQNPHSTQNTSHLFWLLIKHTFFLTV